MSIEDSLANEGWLTANESKIKALFPEELTNIQDLNGIKIGSELRKMGVDWRSEKEFEMIMVFFQQLGFVIRNEQKVQRNPKSIF